MRVGNPHSHETAVNMTDPTEPGTDQPTTDTASAVLAELNTARRELEEANQAFRVERRGRCTAKNASGNPCKRYAVRGAFVCVFHGGGAPQVKAKAERLLMRGRDIAIDRLLDAIDDGHDHPPCEHCGCLGQRDPLVLKMAVAVLDRTGLGPTAKLELEPGGGITEIRRTIVDPAPDPEADEEAAAPRAHHADTPQNNQVSIDLGLDQS